MDIWRIRCNPRTGVCELCRRLFNKSHNSRVLGGMPNRGHSVWERKDCSSLSLLRSYFRFQGLMLPLSCVCTNKEPPLPLHELPLDCTLTRGGAAFSLYCRVRFTLDGFMKLLFRASGWSHSHRAGGGLKI